MPQLKLADSADSAAMQMQKEKEKGSQKDGKRGFGPVNTGKDLEEQAHIPRTDNFLKVQITLTITSVREPSGKNRRLKSCQKCERRGILQWQT